MSKPPTLEYDRRDGPPPDRRVYRAVTFVAGIAAGVVCVTAVGLGALMPVAIYLGGRASNPMTRVWTWGIRGAAAAWMAGVVSAVLFLLRPVRERSPARSLLRGTILGGCFAAAAMFFAYGTTGFIQF